MIHEVRTIKPTDTWIYESAASQIVSDSRCRRARDVDALKELLPLRQRELNAELHSPNPNTARINSLRQIVANLRHTLNSIQR